MGVFGTIIQISALLMLNAATQIAIRHAVASQLVGHDYLRLILQSLQRTVRCCQYAPGSAPPLCHGTGQVSKVMCRAQRNTDALLMPVAMVAKPANRPTIVTTKVTHA
jgi:hypothetical protein